VESIMTMEEERIQEIKHAFFEYAKENELSAFDTPQYFAKQILPNVSFPLKIKVIGDLIESEMIVEVNQKLVIKNVKG
jgi:hypothetical protein